MKLTKEQINNFFEVVKQLGQEQKGAFGLLRGRRFDILVLKYVGLGEGLQYETAQDYDLKELKKDLYTFNGVE